MIKIILDSQMIAVTKNLQYYTIIGIRYLQFEADSDILTGKLPHKANLVIFQTSSSNVQKRWHEINGGVVNNMAQELDVR